MLDVTVSADSSASPEQVLAGATDFSHRRGEIWPNSKPANFHLHESGPDFAEVTEGFRPPFGRVWERSRYTWNEPGSIHQSVLDSNVLSAGSTWELEVRPRDGGSSVEMRLNREFLRTPKGRMAKAINHLGGRRMWRWYLRRALRAVEKRSA